MYEINETHDPSLKSWVESANDPNSDFPIQNLPFCTFKKSRTDILPVIGVRIGNELLDLVEMWHNGVLETDDPSPYDRPFAALNDVLRADVGQNSRVRQQLIFLLSENSDQKKIIERYLIPAAKAEIVAPVYIGDYTDFYSSVYHATNVGSMFRPDQPLMPNYKYVPIGYHGRASSIVVSGTDIKRPHGQNRSDAEKPPVFIPARNLDYEMELGFFVGQENEIGSPIPISQAEKHIFGMCLVNDWSARDIQAWEYQPLGPFLAKSFATTISPFVVTMEALAPFRTPAFEREEGDPQPLEYLSDENNKKFGGLDINLEVYIETQKMRDSRQEPFMISRSNTKDLYWTVGQMLAHHASNGCNMRTGDLIASGTVSGKEKDERGCLLERTWRGTEPIDLPSGETRRFLEDGDEIIMKGFCEREGFRRIGFGECRGRIVSSD